MLSNSPSTSSSSTWMKKYAFFCVSNTTLASCHQARGGIGQKVLFHITAAVCCESCTAVWGEDAMTYTLSLIQFVSCHTCLEWMKNAIRHWADRPMIVHNNMEWTFSQVLRSDLSKENAICLHNQKQPGDTRCARREWSKVIGSPI